MGFHNWFLDKGMKFMVSYKSPLIRKTDLFDQLKFGCWDDLRDMEGEDLISAAVERMGKILAKWTECTLQGRCGKDWEQHPRIYFNTTLREIGVKLQDLTSGDIRWDAVYSIYGRELKSL